MVESEWLTSDEVCEILKISKSTVARYVRRGDLRAIRLPGGKRGHYRIPRTEVDRLLEPRVAS
jgi:excisionase family DNA binding protein